MAHDIRRDTGTPAETLRRLLDRAERLLPDLRTNPAAASELLTAMDEITALFATLEGQGMDLRPERGRWEGLQRGQQPDRLCGARHTRLGPRTPGGTGHSGPPLVVPGSDVGRARRRNRRRTLVAAGAGIAALALIVIAWRLLFPVDPAVAAAQRAMELGQRYVRLHEWEAAYASYVEAAQATPDDAIPVIWLGVLKEQLGDRAAPRPILSRRHNCCPIRCACRSKNRLRTTRSASTSRPKRRHAALAIDPNSPHAHYVLAGALERQHQIEAALAEFDLASQLAEKVDANLAALARIRLATLMQTAPLLPADEPTATP
ncbi:MAG: hypothetical protein HZY76_14825 [Anaerolineae bacterium]|nr:MAG: hypothetical protein HZY76_14825 [Anaerolineae bacterium]